MTNCKHTITLGSGTVIEVAAYECPTCNQAEIKRLMAENHTLTNRLADSMADADRLAALIKHAQKLGLFRASAYTSAQAIEVLDKHSQTTWED